MAIPDEAWTQLLSEFSHIRNIVYMQVVEIRVLRDYIVSSAQDEQAAREQILRMTQQAYDAMISKLENDYPAYATQIDFREHLPPEDQDDWYFPPSPPPKFP